MAQINIHNGGYYAHAQASNAYNFCLSWNSTKFIRTFMWEYLKVNNMAQILNHSGGYVHAQNSNASNSNLS